jgi:hypothetical protein
MTMYVADEIISRMADAALHAYEMTCSWSQAGDAAREMATDDYGFKPTRNCVGLAVRIAQMRWEGVRAAVRAAIAED